MLVRDAPAAALLAQSDGQPQALLRMLGETRRHATAQQRMRKGDVRTGRDVEGDDLEDRALAQPDEERLPGRAVGLEAAGAVLGGGTSNMTISSV